MNRYLIVICTLLITACASFDSQWSAYNSRGQGFKNTGNIEYNGIGGSGRQQDSLPENGIGGSGIQLRSAQANGLGGSGRQAPDLIENGLGGSGKTLDGKAAILGPISAFGSIWVNDRHIQLPDSTEYLIAGKDAQRSDLRLGQMVAVLADSLDDSDYQALEVHLLFNVIGALESIDINPYSKKAGKLSLMGQTILFDKETRIENHLGEAFSLQQLKIGERLAISGLRMPNQQIKATLLIAQPKQGTLLAGPISVIDGQYWLAQQALSFGDKQPVLDQPIRMQGQVSDGIFIVDQWQTLPHHRIFELADEVWLEGFPLSDAEFFIEGFEVQLPEFTDDLFDPNDSMRIGIDMNEQEFWMEHESPMDDMQWQEQEFETRWQEDDGFMRRGPEPQDSEFDGPEMHGPEFDGPEFDGPEFDDPYFDQPYHDEPSYDDQGYYPYEPPPRHP